MLSTRITRTALTEYYSKYTQLVSQFWDLTQRHFSFRCSLGKTKQFYSIRKTIFQEYFQ